MDQQEPQVFMNGEEQGPLVYLPPGDQEAPVTSLCALDRVFDATGNATVKVGTRLLTLPIQAVDVEFVEALCKPWKPKVPTVREHIKGQWVTVVNENEEQYKDRLAAYNIRYTYMHACCGIAVDIIDAQHRVVWSADNRTHDADGAIAALKQMGLVLNHVVSINEAIQALTRYTVEEQSRD